MRVVVIFLLCCVSCHHGRIVPRSIHIQPGNQHRRDNSNENRGHNPPNLIDKIRGEYSADTINKFPYNLDESANPETIVDDNIGFAKVDTVEDSGSASSGSDTAPDLGIKDAAVDSDTESADDDSAPRFIQRRNNNNNLNAADNDDEGGDDDDDDDNKDSVFDLQRGWRVGLILLAIVLLVCSVTYFLVYAVCYFAGAQTWSCCTEDCTECMCCIAWHNRRMELKRARARLKQEKKEEKRKLNKADDLFN